MNLIFVQGKVVSNVEFDFIINSKNLSIARFDIELSNKSIVKCRAYDEVADFCYSKLKNTDNIFIEGEVTNMNIEIKYILLL